MPSRGSLLQTRHRWSYRTFSIHEAVKAISLPSSRARSRGRNCCDRSVSTFDRRSCKAPKLPWKQCGAGRSRCRLERSLPVRPCVLISRCSSSFEMAAYAPSETTIASSRGKPHAVVSSPRVSTMKAYLITTAVVFTLIVFAHVLRVIDEGLRLLADPAFIGTSIAALGLSLWAVVLLRKK